MVAMYNDPKGEGSEVQAPELVQAAFLRQQQGGEG
jgi:hypothetical protein